MKLNKRTVSRVLEVVDAGLSHGLGQRFPGHMCVEAAVCYALGLPHGDDPKCVSQAVRSLKIKLNDSPWSSRKARALGMRKLAVLQLGTSENFDDEVFAEKVAMFVINVTVADLYEVLGPKYKKHTEALRSASTIEEGKDAAYLAANYSTALSNGNAAQAAAQAHIAAAVVAPNAAVSAALHAAVAVAATKKPSMAIYDVVLAKFAEGVCQILIEMGVQGVKYLNLLQ